MVLGVAPRALIPGRAHAWSCGHSSCGMSKKRDDISLVFDLFLVRGRGAEREREKTRQGWDRDGGGRQREVETERER